jgi:hypothetical protein
MKDKMKIWETKKRRKTAVGIGLCMSFVAWMAASSLACAQASDSSSGPRVMVSSSEPAAAQVVREIDDPHTGNRWLLLRDGAHPGGPGRLVLVPKAETKHAETAADGQKSALAEVTPGEFHPIIRAGDKLIVEEHTAVIDTYLEAVALGPAVAGAVFGVRLKLGGKMMQAVALGPGRAAMQVGTEVQP